MASSQMFLVLIVLVCFAIGFGIVSAIMKWRNGEGTKSGGGGLPEGRAGTAPTNAASQIEPSNPKPDAFESIETYYRHLLGVSVTAGEQEIKTAYEAQLDKYCPDKMVDLGDDYYRLSYRRTKEIITAFEYLRRKYRFN